jgi:5-(carboxyamino)imidazole ribonucleotide synthase
MTASSQLTIVGGGQLGMFLCQAAGRLGISAQIVTSDGTAPATGIADSSIVSDYDAAGLAKRIAEFADVVTFEFEAVPEALLAELESCEQAGDFVVRPAINTLRLLKNKATQKTWLAEQGFPTMPFSVEEAPAERYADLVAQFGLPLVQKAQTGGYDGYGVQVLAQDAKPEDMWPIPSIIEHYLEKPVELGVVVARSVTGDMQVYPPVRMAFDHDRNILDAVVQPTGLSAAIDQQATDLARSVIERLEGVGVFAVELFLDDSRDETDQLLINEISPRVHNSGHVTLDSDKVSQFEQHVRAVCGLPLGEPAARPPAAVMRNLLYSDRMAALVEHADGPLTVRHNGSSLYWYGKQEGRDGRKMGHTTILTDNIEQSADAAEQVLEVAIRQVSEKVA